VPWKVKPGAGSLATDNDTVKPLPEARTFVVELRGLTDHVPDTAPFATSLLKLPVKVPTISVGVDKVTTQSIICNAYWPSFVKAGGPVSTRPEKLPHEVEARTAGKEEMPARSVSPRTSIAATPMAWICSFGIVFLQRRPGIYPFFPFSKKRDGRTPSESVREQSAPL
jgi:hypothetical protein